MLTDEIKKDIDGLESFASAVSMYSDTQENFSIFRSLVRSSFVKNYEFLKKVLSDKFEDHFFVTSFLRSIVEDIIVLESIHSLSSEKREKLLKGIQLLEVQERILKQWDFFQKYRPFQPVIDKGYLVDQAKLEVQSIWRESGWPNFEVKPKKLMPPTADMARKLAPGILDILYEFIYRLSSGTVHFSPQTLLRMSWGNIDKDNNASGIISVKHMRNYHRTFCQVYGALLFTFYFEFFAEEIDSTDSEQTTIVNVRKTILKELRWPEMITFEEMNLPIPNAYHDQIVVYGLVHQGIIELLKNGFVKNDYQNFLDVVKH